jgi:hypothetical protein
METSTQRTEGQGRIDDHAKDSPDHYTIVVTECPRCDRSQSLRLPNAVDATSEPSLEPEILSRALMTHVCSACATSYEVEYDFVYTDPERNFAILLPRGAFPAGVAKRVLPQRDQRRRLAGSWAQLIEKILIFDSGLDDHAVELVKISVCRQLMARYESALARLGAKPLDVARVSFHGLDHRGTGGDVMEFLLWASPTRLPVVVRAPLAAAMRGAEEHLRRHPPEVISSSAWEGVDPHWAIRSLGGLENGVLIPLDVEVIVDPVRAGSPVTKGFLDHTPVVRSGSRRPLPLSGPVQTNWRPQHYHFAHRRLRVVFNTPERWIGALHSPERYEVIRQLWSDVTEVCRAGGESTPLGPDSIKVHTARIQAYPTAIIEMIPPVARGEAYFIALVLRRIQIDAGASANELPPLAYYTLELGHREDDESTPCTYLCEWKQDGSRRNYGYGPAPNLADFVEAVAAHVRETSIVRDPLPPEVLR